MTFRAKFQKLMVTALVLSWAAGAWAQVVLVEAESFENKGGWVVDQQFMDQMGSPFLLAHGMGESVADATTTVTVPSAGEYYVFVRTWDWCSPWNTTESPGRFQVLIDGKPIEKVFGIEGSSWGWVKAGPVSISSKRIELGLRDLTGFDGRCDAVLLTTDPAFVPPAQGDKLRTLRKKLLGLPLAAPTAGEFDLVVVGGGIAGTSAAISASRLGLKVALIQDRSVLGGNSSPEIRIVISGKLNQPPYPQIGNVVSEISNLREQPDKLLALARSEPNLTLFLNTHVNAVEMNGSRIVSVIGANIETSEELRFAAALFADCTGDGTVGFLAGADYRMGRETRMETGETLAPEVGDNLSYGSTIMWTNEDINQPCAFAACPWAIQFTEASLPENVKPWFCSWEAGFYYNQIDDFEYIRDYMLRAIYGNWAYLKNFATDRSKYAKKKLTWVGYIAGKRESRRLLGDVILKQQNIEGQTAWPDAAVTATYSIDQHFPHPENTVHFPREEFISLQKHNHNPIGLSRAALGPERLNDPYQIPYRCLYSRNIDNLFMAGRNISVTRIALTSVRVQGTCGMMGEVVAIAASLCEAHKITPRAVYEKYLNEFKDMLGRGIACQER